MVLQINDEFISGVKRGFLLSIIILLSLIVLWCISLLFLYAYSLAFGKDKIRETATKIAENEKDEVVIIKKLIEWERANMFPTYNYSGYLPMFPYYPIRIPEAPWIINTMYGGCEEYAVLFVEMAKSLGIPARVVYNTAEDHVWAEVFIKGSWIHVDPSSNIFNNPGVYEKPDGWNKQISYVYYIDSDGNKHDITRRYTETGKLVIKVTKNGRPIKNATVIAKSRFLLERYPNSRIYKKPRESTRCKTNDDGSCAIEVGGNNYTILAVNNIFFGLIGFAAEKTITVEENKIKEIEIEPDKLSILPAGKVLIVLIFLTIIIFIIGANIRKKLYIKKT